MKVAYKSIMWPHLEQPKQRPYSPYGLSHVSDASAHNRRIGPNDSSKKKWKKQPELDSISFAGKASGGSSPRLSRNRDMKSKGKRLPSVHVEEIREVPRLRNRQQDDDMDDTFMTSVI